MTRSMPSSARVPLAGSPRRTRDGRLNLAPYSFFNAFNYTPPMIGFSSMGAKDSVSNIAETGEFCWNLATKALAAPMNLTSAPGAAGCERVRAGRADRRGGEAGRRAAGAESPVNFECRLSQIIQLQSADGDVVDSWLVLGEVVAVHIDKA